MAETFARSSEPETQMHTIDRDGMNEIFLTRRGATVEDVPEMSRALAASSNAEAVCAEYFGGTAAEVERWGEAFSDDLNDLPLTWILGSSWGEGLGGVHLKAVADASVRALTLDGRPVGTVVEGPHADEVLLAGMHSPDVSASPTTQARATFERMEEALALAAMDFSHVARTWLYLDNILSWYADFNRVRTAFFEERGVFERMVPASTGIGGANSLGAAMVAGVYAVRAKTPAVTVEPLPSPLQCPALDYGSSFSRAVEVTMPDLRRVLVSGTASIDPDGRTAHVGDVSAQTALTCEVIGAILQSRGMGWQDVTRATAYVRHAADAGVLQRHCEAAGIPPLPVIVAHNVICRHDLLFELEVDAARTTLEGVR